MRTLLGCSNVRVASLRADWATPVPPPSVWTQWFPAVVKWKFARRPAKGLVPLVEPSVSPTNRSPANDTEARRQAWLPMQAMFRTAVKLLWRQLRPQHTSPPHEWSPCNWKALFEQVVELGPPQQIDAAFQTLNLLQAWWSSRVSHLSEGASNRMIPSTNYGTGIIPSPYY